jgi:hypothetical protein
MAILSASSATAAEAPLTRQLSLRPGESATVSYPIGTDLTVSRRGIVDAFSSGDGRWQLTALRGGFVVVDAKDATTGEPRPPRLLIEVHGARDEAPTTPAIPPLSGPPPWVCTTPGIKCDQGAGIVRGTTDSYLWYVRARTACRESEGCLFAATLSKAGTNAWIDALQAQVGDHFGIIASAAGIPALTTYCAASGRPRRTNDADDLTDGAVTSGLLHLRCLDEDDPRAFRLSVRVFLVESAAARELGIDQQINATAQAPARTISTSTSWSILAKLKALATDHRAESIGEPVVRIHPNVPVNIVSGGEFQVFEHIVRAAHDDEPEERAAWKQFGLTMKLMAAAVSPKVMHLAYDLSFKSRTQASDLALTVNAIKSDVNVTPGGPPVMAGALDLKASSDDHQRVPLLSHLPILGPLFTLTGKEQSSSRLLVWLELADDDGAKDLR